MSACRWCGAEDGPPHHVYGERKCCPDCDHRLTPCDVCGQPAGGEMSMEIEGENVLLARYCYEHSDRMLPGEVLGDEDPA